MEISPYLQLMLLVYSFWLGIGLGVLRDGIRAVRTLLGQTPNGKIAAWYEKELPWIHRRLRVIGEGRIRKSCVAVVTFLLDILFFLAAGCGIAVLQYSLNSGRFRMLSVVAAMVGFFLYVNTVGRITGSALQGAIFLVRAGGAILCHLLLFPFRMLIRAVRLMGEKIRKKVQRVLAKRQILRYNKRKKKELWQRAKEGFLS